MKSLRSFLKKQGRTLKNTAAGVAFTTLGVLSAFSNPVYAGNPPKAFACKYFEDKNNNREAEYPTEYEGLGNNFEDSEVTLIFTDFKKGDFVRFAIYKDGKKIGESNDYIAEESDGKKYPLSYQNHTDDFPEGGTYRGVVFLNNVRVATIPFSISK